MKITTDTYPLGSPIPVLDVVEESASYYIARSPSDRLDVQICAKAVWKPVLETKWVSVTGSLEIREDRHTKSGYDPGGVFHNGERLANLVCGGRYRIRKVEYYCSPCLIVEKKECC